LTHNFPADYNPSCFIQSPLANPDRTASNNLKGKTINDKIFGYDGDDNLTGLTGDDLLIGGKGGELIFSGKGNDRLIGGEGSDQFVLRPNTGTDRIVDFQDGDDTIVLTGGLNFDRVSISQSFKGTNISLKSNGQTLAILVGVDSGLITAADFVP
jgi:Ca2+-binding RTX toxin-like protein